MLTSASPDQAPASASIRAVLFWVMALSAIWECVITVSLFIYPEFEAAQFHNAVNDQTIFLSNVIGGFMILFSALCWLCAFQIRSRNPNGLLLAEMIGVFWIYMGLGLFFHPGAPAYVLLDTVRGVVICVLALTLTYSADSNSGLINS